MRCSQARNAASWPGLTRDEITAETLLDWLRPKLPKWWLPDEVVFLPELPHTATGKVKKADLRALLNKES